MRSVATTALAVWFAAGMGLAADSELRLEALLLDGGSATLTAAAFGPNWRIAGLRDEKPVEYNGLDLVGLRFSPKSAPGRPRGGAGHRGGPVRPRLPRDHAYTMSLPCIPDRLTGGPPRD